MFLLATRTRLIMSAPESISIKDRLATTSSPRSHLTCGRLEREPSRNVKLFCKIRITRGKRRRHGRTVPPLCLHGSLFRGRLRDAQRRLAITEGPIQADGAERLRGHKLEPVHQVAGQQSVAAAEQHVGAAVAVEVAQPKQGEIDSNGAEQLGADDL